MSGLGGRCAALSIALFLAACAMSDPPPMTATTTVTPHLTAADYVAVDGAQLPMRSWLPKGPIKAVILALHGFNDYSHAFQIPATIWAEDGIATFAYDQRGFGAAPDRGRWVGTYRLDADAAAVTRLLRARYPDVPFYLLGESMGAAVAITAETGWAGAERPKVDGVILVAPAVWGRQTMNVFMRATLWLADHVAPGWTLTGASLHILASDNIPMLRALSRDPLVIKATRIDTINGLVNLMSEALAAAPKMNQRVLLLYGAHDEVVPKRPVAQFAADMPPVPPGRRVLAWYDQGYHMLLRDLDAPLVARDIESWIFDPGAPLPSGADRRATAELLPQSPNANATIAAAQTPAD